MNGRYSSKRRSKNTDYPNYFNKENLSPVNNRKTIRNGIDYKSIRSNSSTAKKSANGRKSSTSSSNFPMSNLIEGMKSDIVSVYHKAMKKKVLRLFLKEIEG